MALTRVPGAFAGVGAVAQHDGGAQVYACSCGTEVVWATSKRTGRRYLAEVRTGRAGQRYYIGAAVHHCNESTGADTMTKTATELRAEAARCEPDAHESFERCDTDGFLSQWASGITAQLKRRQADITEAGGTAEFPALFDLDGNWVPAKVIDGTYGARWMVLDAEGQRTGTYLPFAPKRRKTLADKGYTEGRVVRPAWAKLGGRGRGLSGTVWVETYPKTREWEPPLSIVCTDRFAE